LKLQMAGSFIACSQHS